MPKATRGAAEATATTVPRGADRQPVETPVDPRTEQAAQLGIDHLLAKIVEAGQPKKSCSWPSTVCPVRHRFSDTDGHA